MLTHTRARVPEDDTEFGDMNGFFAVGSVSTAITCTIWTQAGDDRTVTIPAGFDESAGFIPLAVKKMVTGNQTELNKIVVLGV